MVARGNVFSERRNRQVAASGEKWKVKLRPVVHVDCDTLWTDAQPGLGVCLYLSQFRCFRVLAVPRFFPILHIGSCSTSWPTL